MKTSVIVLVALLSFVSISSDVHSASNATAYLQISGARLEKHIGSGVWMPATAGMSGSDVPSFGVSHMSTTRIDYSGFAQIHQVGSGLFDAPRSFVSPSLLAPHSTENYFDPLSNLLSYAIADTDGSGSLVTPGGALVQTLADLNALVGQIGRSSGRVSAGGSFVAGNTGDYRLFLVASGRLEVVSDAYSVAGAGMGFGGNINTVGVGGGLLTDLFPAALNQSISGTGLVSFLNQEFISVPFTLVAGHTYSFNINQGSVASLNAVPEPASLVVAGILGCASFDSAAVQVAAVQVL
jgi:hypothetical protein